MQRVIMRSEMHCATADFERSYGSAPAWLWDADIDVIPMIVYVDAGNRAHERAAAA
jgi:hypothetical protein